MILSVQGERNKLVFKTTLIIDQCVGLYLDLGKTLVYLTRNFMILYTSSCLVRIVRYRALYFRFSSVLGLLIRFTSCFQLFCVSERNLTLALL
jgi:hypothetical protein